MAFEMSLPHAPRIQQLAADGTELPRQDEQQWDIYYTVQAVLQKEEEEEEEAAAGPQGGGGADKALAGSKAPQPSDPAKVLEKLLTARGELDVITDLVTFVEQQQFMAVEGLHRHPPTLEERLRARALRLAASRQQLRGAGALVARGLAALQAQASVDNRFLADLAELRGRWKLRRYSGAGGLFYADIGLPLRGAAAQGVSQEGAQCSIIQDTNGDACMVETGPGSKRHAVRGWRAIHSVLQLKQQLLAWRVLQQMVQAQPQQAQQESDPDGAVAAVQALVAAAVAACQAALHRAVASGAGGGEAAAAAAMDVGGAAGGSSGPPVAAAAAAAAAGAPALPSSMLSSAAKDLQAALALPGFQAQFEGRALALLSRLVAGGPGSCTQQGRHAVQQGVLDSLLQWLRHAALCCWVAGALRRWCAPGGGRAVQRLDSQEAFTAVWRLTGGRCGAYALPTLVVACGSAVRIEGGAAAAVHPGTGVAWQGSSRAEFEQQLAEL